MPIGRPMSPGSVGGVHRRTRRRTRRRTTAVVGAAAGTAGYAAGKSSQKNADEATQPDQETQAQEQPHVDPTQELEKLADLKEKGLITEEEYTAKKKQLLGI